MKKIVLLSLFLALSLTARENPFSPQKMIKAPTPMPLPPKIIVQKPIEVIKKVEIKKVPMKIPEIKKVEKTIPVIVTKEIIKVKKHKKIKKKKIKKPKAKYKSKLIYNGKFAKINLNKNSIKILTKDEKLQHLSLTHPNRLVIDFERYDVVHPFYKKIYSPYIKNIKIGHHEYYYRITFELNRKNRYTVVKMPYGYLIKFIR